MTSQTTKKCPLINDVCMKEECYAYSWRLKTVGKGIFNWDYKRVKHCTILDCDLPMEDST